jgi:hypothetical protein
MVNVLRGIDRTCRSVRGRRLLQSATLALCGLALADTSARADVPQISIQAATAYDDNVYRAPAQLQKELSHGGSDIGSTIGATGSYDANLDPATLSLQFNAQKTFYAYNAQLNAFEYNLTGNLKVTGGHGDVTLTLAQQRVASSFDDVRIGPRNIQTLSLAQVNANIVVAGALGVMLGVTGTLNRNSGEATSFGDNRRIDATAGIGYNSRALGNVLALEFEYITQHALSSRGVIIGDVPVVYRPQYVQESAGLRLDYQSSVFLSVKAHAGYAHFEDQSGIGKNQSGFVGDLSVSYSLTQFLTATIHGARSFSGTEDIYSNGVKTVSFGGGITGQPAEGWNAGIGYTYSNRRFSYDFQAVDPLALSRTEHLSDINASLSHPIPLRGSITVQVDHRWRRSNLFDYNYTDTSATVTLTVPITR